MKKDGFSYFWDQTYYSPVTHFGKFHIHFKRRGEKKRQKVFSYDWRMWGLAEIKDILEEVDFLMLKSIGKALMRMEMVTEFFVRLERVKIAKLG